MVENWLGRRPMGDEHEALLANRTVPEEPTAAKAHIEYCLGQASRFA